MAKKAKKRVRKEWTKEDVRALKAHSKAKTPVTKIAKEMKRTEATLRSESVLARPWARTSTLGTFCCHKRRSASLH